MFYIHHTVCISPQNTFPKVELEQLIDCSENKLYAKDFPVADVPTAQLRRMGKAVKLGVAASLPLFKKYDKFDGIIIGTSNGGMEDCIKFLNQIMQYEEGVLTPTNFVQSTPNAIASQLGFLSKNNGYNITHVHRGLSFENALIDAGMLLEDYPDNKYLVGGIDEISTYNFNIDYLCGYVKKELISNNKLYNSKTEGSLAGEGVAMFVINNNREGATSKFRAIETIHTTEENELQAVCHKFLNDNLSEKESIDLFLSGENGDSRYTSSCESVEKMVNENIPVARFKHMSGEFRTASAFSLWVANYIIQTQQIPAHMLKKNFSKGGFNNILIYNNYQGFQHSFMLLSKS